MKKYTPCLNRMQREFEDERLVKYGNIAINMCSAFKFIQLGTEKKSHTHIIMESSTSVATGRLTTESGSLLTRTQQNTQNRIKIKKKISLVEFVAITLICNTFSLKGCFHLLFFSNSSSQSFLHV